LTYCTESVPGAVFNSLAGPRQSLLDC